jgi:gamma-glutamylcyclotransferase
MDAHHDQVQRARALAQGGAPRNYFAYSTVLDRAAFEEWRGQHGYTDFELPAGQLAEARDLQLVFDFPSRWWGGRVAGLADSPGGRVWGKLFTLSAADWPIVQHKEGAITGMCVERELEVFVDGSPVRAVAFTTAPQRQSLEGPISARFVAALQSGARAAGLPETYQRDLAALMGG